MTKHHYGWTQQSAGTPHDVVSAFAPKQQRAYSEGPAGARLDLWREQRAADRIKVHARGCGIGLGAPGLRQHLRRHLRRRDGIHSLQ